MCAHIQASRDVTRSITHDPWSLNLKNSQFPDSEGRLQNPALSLPESRSAFWTLASDGPVAPSQLFSALPLLLWVFFRPEVLLLGCSFSVHNCIWWGAFF